jgi:CRP-like cAMP-binding protein
MSFQNIPTEDLDPWLITLNLDEEALAVVKDKAEIINLPARENIFVEGDEDAAAMFLILEGMVLVLKKDEQGQERTVSIIVEGQSFGEVGLLVDQPRMATVSAGIDTILLKITPAVLEDLEQNHPHVAMSIYKGLARSFAYQWIEMVNKG